MTDTYTQNDTAAAIENTQYFTAQPASLSTFDRIIAVFTSPKEAFAGIENESKGTSIWGMAILIAVLLTTGSSILRYYVTDAPQKEYEMRHSQYDRMLKSPKIPEENKQAMRQQMANDTPSNPPIWRPVVTGILIVLLPFFISSLVFFVFGKFVFGVEEFSFTPLLIASALTYVISSVGDIVNLILQSITYDSTMILGPSLFVGSDMQSPAFAFTSQLGVFKIWDLAIFSIGYASLCRRSNGVAMSVVFGTWLLRIILWTAMAIFFQHMGS